MQIARAYMGAADPDMPLRTWQVVIKTVIDSKKGPNQTRWKNAEKDKAMAPLWKLRVVETRAHQLLRMLQNGTVSTNVFLRRLHNFAQDMSWLPWPILPKKLWPKVVYQEKRAITKEEHLRIVAREKNPERRDFYELAWCLGASQTDLAFLHAEDIDWKERTVFYRRKKNGRNALQHFGGETAAVLNRRPKVGPLFPYLITVREADRASEFKQRCTGLGIAGVTLHSYRYGWAERAAECGYPERHSQSALGHGSKAVARAYAKKAKVKAPALEDYEKAHHNGTENVVQIPQDIDLEMQRLQAPH